MASCFRHCYHHMHTHTHTVLGWNKKGCGRVCPLPGNEAISKVRNLFMFQSSWFRPSDRSKAAFPEALSWKPEGETQSNSVLQQYSTKQYNQTAIISHPKGKSNIFPSFFSSFSLPSFHHCWPFLSLPRLPSLIGKNKRTSVKCLRSVSPRGRWLI